MFKAFACVDGSLVECPSPRVAESLRRLVVGTLTKMRESPRPVGPQWQVDISIQTDETGHQVLPMLLEPFLSAGEYQRSINEPVPFSQLATAPVETPGSHHALGVDCIWIFRDAIYATERRPKPSEFEEIVLRIKALHFEDDQELARLRDQVANYEAVGEYKSGARSRQVIPDHVKLLVWARDGGACVRCGATTDLHFDHIIPFSRGGGDDAENIQLLCRTCNLAKGPRLV